MLHMRGIFGTGEERTRVTVPMEARSVEGRGVPKEKEHATETYQIGMTHLLPSRADRGNALRMWALLRARYPEYLRNAMKCEVLCVENTTYTLRVRGVLKVGYVAMEPVLRNCPDTILSYEADGGATNRATHGIDLHLVLKRHRQVKSGGVAAADPRKRALSSSDESDDDGTRRRRASKRRPDVDVDIPVCMSTPPLRIVLDKPVALPRVVLETVERNDRPSVSDITNAVCNADASMPRIELTVIPHDMDYMLVYAGARLLGWPLVRYIRTKFPSVANIEITVRRPEALARKLLGDSTPNAEIRDLASVWDDISGTDKHMSALIVLLVRSTTFATTGAGEGSD